MLNKKYFIYFLIAIAHFLLPLNAMGKPIVVASKIFTESVILGEILAQSIQSQGYTATHRKELGGTQVLFKALQNGDIDAYVDYSGTIKHELFAGKDPNRIEEYLQELGISMSAPLGFNNTYAIGTTKALAQKLNLKTVSDLAQHTDLKLGFSNEFMDRADGWPGLQAKYQLPHHNVKGLNHDLAYRGLNSGDIDVVDLYSTDAEIGYYNLQVLQDNKSHFPKYNAVILYRSDLKTKAPKATVFFDELAGTIPEPKMIAMNKKAKIDRISEDVIAAEFLNKTFNIDVKLKERSLLDNLYDTTKEHLYIVAISLFAAILLAVPLGIAAAYFDSFARVILSIVGIIQTIPSLALLVFMIPFLGIGSAPAIFALFLYSLLPIVRNTYTGLTTIPSDLVESARVLGLSTSARLLRIEIPLALPTILAGIKTSAIINVGTATLGALIGAGGYGQPILTGIRLDDMQLIFQGAIPAAILALFVQGFFEIIEKVSVPKQLRGTM